MKKKALPKITRRGYILRCKHGLAFYWDKNQASNGTCNLHCTHKDSVAVRLVPYRKGV